jgi:hypothetical protein
MLSTPADPNSKTIGEQVRCLQSYKASFLDSDIVAVFVVLLTETLSKDCLDRSDDEVSRSELLLWLLRNLLAVPDAPPSANPSADPYAHLHDRLLTLLDQESFFELLVVVVESMDDDSEHSVRWSLLVLEILYFIFRCETAESLVGDTSNTFFFCSALCVVIHVCST